MIKTISNLKNSKGMTLIELIATFGILTMVLSIVTTIIMTSTRFFAQEESQIDRQTHLRLLALQVESDIRRSNQDIKEIDSCLQIGDHVDYCLENNQIKRNDVIMASNIGDFSWSIDNLRHIVFLDFRSTEDIRGNLVYYSTRIYLRQQITHQGGD